MDFLFLCLSGIVKLKVIFIFSLFRCQDYTGLIKWARMYISYCCVINCPKTVVVQTNEHLLSKRFCVSGTWEWFSRVGSQGFSLGFSQDVSRGCRIHFQDGPLTCCWEEASVSHHISISIGLSVLMISNWFLQEQVNQQKEWGRSCSAFYELFA